MQELARWGPKDDELSLARLKPGKNLEHCFGTNFGIKRMAHASARLTYQLSLEKEPQLKIHSRDASDSIFGFCVCHMASLFPCSSRDQIEDNPNLKFSRGWMQYRIKVGQCNQNFPKNGLHFALRRLPAWSSLHIGSNSTSVKLSSLTNYFLAFFSGIILTFFSLNPNSREIGIKLLDLFKLQFFAGPTCMRTQGEYLIMLLLAALPFESSLHLKFVNGISESWAHGPTRIILTHVHVVRLKRLHHYSQLALP